MESQQLFTVPQLRDGCCGISLIFIIKRFEFLDLIFCYKENERNGSLNQRQLTM
jgi:hypothetical protein